MPRFTKPRKVEEVERSCDGTIAFKGRHPITYTVLEGLFHLPLIDAARQVGLSTTTFKKACRLLNLERWPFRKMNKKMKAKHAVTGYAIGVPMPRQPTTEACGWEHGDTMPLDAGPPGGWLFGEDKQDLSYLALEADPPGGWLCGEDKHDLSCVEAVMDYLDGPLAKTFDFMFVDEE
jgi:hypothetical protein